MSGLVFGCIVPHGAEIVPFMSLREPLRMRRTTEAMEQLATQLNASRPDVYVVITPHGLRARGQYTVSVSEWMEGSYTHEGTSMTMKRQVDQGLAEEIVTAVKEAEIPVVAAYFATAAGPLCSLPLDWGAMIPLSFFGEKPIVVITPDRTLGTEAAFEFGQALGRALLKSHKRVALIASCDWSHTHEATGPYGYHPFAKALDERVVQYVKNNALESLHEFSDSWIEGAKPDGIWQALVLAGAMPRDQRETALLSYEAPTYFGQLVATVLPKIRR